MKTQLRVHICVVGFEIDRICKAAIREKADKVYLIEQENNDDGKWAVDENERILKEHENNIDVQRYPIDNIRDIQPLIKAIREIIVQEEGNFIYINISSGGCRSAIAGIMSSMMFSNGTRIIPYYVTPESYQPNSKSNARGKKAGARQPLSYGIKQIEEIITFPLAKPSKELISVLKHIRDKENGLHKAELIDFCKTNTEILKWRKRQANIVTRSNNLEEDPTKGKARDYAWINQNIVSKLKDEWRLIDEEKVGKTKLLHINDEGRKMLKYLEE